MFGDSPIYATKTEEVSRLFLIDHFLSILKSKSGFTKIAKSCLAGSFSILYFPFKLTTFVYCHLIDYGCRLFILFSQKVLKECKTTEIYLIYVNIY